MKRYTHIIIILMLSIIVAPVKAMENGILVKTSDNKEYRLPQWKIESSRVLQTKQGLQIFKGKNCGALLAPIVLKTINKQKLQLFSDALDSLYFPHFFDKKLTLDEKKLLFCAAGPQELDCSYIMYQFLKMLCPQEVIKYNINSYLPTADIEHYLQGLVIADNCKYKNFTRTKSENYTEDLVCNDDGSYYRLPKILLPQSNFSGLTFPFIGSIPNSESDDRWYIEKIKKIVQEKNYILTPMEHVNENDLLRQMFLKENKKRLWIKRYENDKGIQKVIEHTNAIECSVFSSDGKYLATSSAGEHGELMLTDLTIENNKFNGFDILLTGHSGSISCICFNKQSTMLAAASKKNIYVWDMQKFSLRAKLECPEGKTHLMRFCYNDNKLITITFDETTYKSIMRLWDITDLTNIDIKLGTTFHNSYVHNILFTPLEDKIIINTQQRAIVMDMLLGELIMDTKIINKAVDNFSSCVDAVLMPYQPILVTAAKNDHNHGSVVLWDINSKERIVTLLEDEKHLCGVGVDVTGRYIVTTTIVQDMITTALYDDNIADCLNWIKTEPTLLQRYLLHRLYVAHKNNDSVFLHPDSPEYRILESLSTAPCLVKEMVEKYLLWKIADNKKYM